MGLDQYLYERTYIGEEFTHRKVELTIDFKIDGEAQKVPRPITYMTSEVMYWRKANQIQEWFQQFTEGMSSTNSVDISVTPTDLINLLNICNKVLERKPIEGRDPGFSQAATPASELLPTSQGFFFGSDEYDDYYYNQIQATKEMLENLKLNTDDYRDFIYNANW